MREKKQSVAGRILMILLKVLGGLLLLALVFLQLIMAAPRQGGEDPEPTEQPLLMASQAMYLTSTSQLADLVQAFPVAVLGCQEGRGLTLVSGGIQDVAVEGGLGRMATLVYQSDTGVRLTAKSIYPARALPLLSGDAWRLADQDGPSVAGVPTVRMEQGNVIRLHMQTDDGLYTIETAGVNGSDLAALVQPFVLLIK